MFKRYLKLWLKFASTSLTREMQYKANFISAVIIELGWSLVTLISIEMMYYNTNSLSGWNKGEVLFIYAIYRFSSATFAIFFRKNIRIFPTLVNTGQFDLYLTKPVNLIFLTSLKTAAFDRISQVAISIAILFYAQQLNPVVWDLSKITLLFFSIILGSLIRYSLSLMIHTTIFWLEKMSNLERLEITLFGVARFPRKAYPDSMNFFFSYFFPVFFVAAVPAEIITGRSNYIYSIELLLVTIVCFIFSILFFNFALKKYSSASS